ncbi:uncharacterized protein [Rutidosis leptorrhynchoides]|uniref:uncharacterized protein n=1 Tax=Rutidosis leptorrhynchoides TaxID=125765 RepID=UPI003A99E18A
MGYSVKNTVGRSGGLLTIWDCSSFIVSQAFEGEFYIAIKGKFVGYETDVVIVNVYGPHMDEKKRRFWTELDAFLRLNNISWVVGGDFNEVRHDDERLNSTFYARRAVLFNEFVINNVLIEFPLVDKRFTRISDDGLQFSKLDRFLVSNNFSMLWDDLAITSLDRKLSDHSPLPLKNGEWSKSTFGKIDEEIKQLESESLYWELEAENRNLSVDERRKWIDTRGKWLEKDRDNRNMLRQKARIKWAIEGDENSNYFHTIIKRMASKNSI